VKGRVRLCICVCALMLSMCQDTCYRDVCMRDRHGHQIADMSDASAAGLRMRVRPASAAPQTKITTDACTLLCLLNVSAHDQSN
jgi:hypothetical protein